MPLHARWRAYLPPSTRVEEQWQVPHSVHDEAWYLLPLRRAVETQVSEAPAGFVQAHGRFEARQRRPQAEVNALAKREVPIRRAGDVEAIWIREFSRVAVGRGQPNDHRLVGG